MLSPCWACCIQAWWLPEATPPLQHPGELLRLPSVPAALLSPCSTAQQQQGGTSHASAAAANTKGAPDAVPLPLVTHSSFQPQVKHELWPSACLGAALLHRGTPHHEPPHPLAVHGSASPRPLQARGAQRSHIFPRGAATDPRLGRRSSGGARGEEGACGPRTLGWCSIL